MNDERSVIFMGGKKMAGVYTLTSELDQADVSAEQIRRILAEFDEQLDEPAGLIL